MDHCQKFTAAWNHEWWLVLCHWEEPWVESLLLCGREYMLHAKSPNFNRAKKVKTHTRSNTKSLYLLWIHQLSFHQQYIHLSLIHHPKGEQKTKSIIFLHLSVQCRDASIQVTWTYTMTSIQVAGICPSQTRTNFIAALTRDIVFFPLTLIPCSESLSKS